MTAAYGTPYSKKSFYTLDAPVDPIRLPGNAMMAVMEVAREYTEFFVALVFVMLFTWMLGANVSAPVFIPVGVVGVFMMRDFLRAWFEFSKVEKM